MFRQGFIAASLFLGVSIMPAQGLAQDLPRAGSLGVSGATTGTGGAKVERVAPGSSAAAMGVLANDVILKFNGADISNFSEVVRAMSGVRGGETVTLNIARDGRPVVLRGEIKPRATETYDGATVTYGAVAHNGGLLRDILVVPAGKPNAPIMYLIAGYSCYSVETAAPGGNLYKELIAGLIARGIGFYRVEKAGMGDSRGGTSCADGDFDAELAGYKAGYEALMLRHRVSANRIFLLGHSMGGVQAPLIAASSGANQPAGVAVFGTALRNWHDYMLQVVGVQSFYANGEDPAKLEDVLEVGRPVLRAIFLEGKSPAEAAAISPQAREFMAQVMNWTEGPDLLFRRHTYWSQVSAQRLSAAWRDTKGEVLALYGEADFAAIDPTDHKRIADIANFYRPGSGQFKLIERTGHGMQIDGTMAQVREAAKSGAPQAPKPYNPQVTKVLADWVDASLAKVVRRTPNP
jgi:pimeloyl-ACP methyl ester carboxylesterase